MKKIVVTLCMVFAIRFLLHTAFAYDEKTTHPALTDEIVDFYNIFHLGIGYFVGWMAFIN